MSDEALKAQAKAYVEKNWEDCVKHIERLVKIRSVEDMSTAGPGKPYGEKPAEALAEACKIAEELGLKATNCDGHIAFADLAGESEKQLAIIGHTDIVPEGHGWNYPPFEVTRKDGYMIGRGVIDDKGPLVVGMYAAKFFKEQNEAEGKLQPYTLRVIMGANEETDMADVEWYTEHYPQPEFLFTPDADFPMIYGEKGGYAASLVSGEILDTIVDFKGGDAGNAVPSLCRTTLKADAAKLPEAERIDMYDEGEGLVKLVAHGVGAHASTPEGSVNAISLIVNYVLDNIELSPAEKSYFELLKLVHADTTGETLGIASEDEWFSPLTIIGGTMRTVDGRLEQSVDSRYPTTTSAEKINEILGKLAKEHGAELRFELDMPPFVTTPDSEGAKALVDTYNEYSGRDSKPFTIGGGTYARHFKAGGAFGPNDPTLPMPKWVGAEHMADEGFEEAQFKRAMEIYIVALARLMRVEF